MKAKLLFPLLIAHALPLQAAQDVDTAWLPGAKEQSLARANEALRMMDITRDALKEFQSEALLQAPVTSQEMPAAVPGKLVAVSDGGLVFDAEQSQLIYLRNVRANDARLRLRASEQLIIQLEKKATRDARKKVPQDVRSGSVSAERIIAPAGSSTTPPATAPASTDSPADTGSTAATHPGPARQPGSSPHPSAGSASASAGGTADTAPAEPVPEVIAPVAVVDMETNRILLSTAGSSGPIRIMRGEDFLQVDTTGGARADVLADELGNLFINGSGLHITWRDRDGQVAELRSPAARVYYHAGKNCFVLEGACNITHPQGSISCTDGLCALLEQGTPPASPRTGFMSQFANMSFGGIRAATAKGDVHLHALAMDEHPESDVRADYLSYDGRTGECLLRGRDCSLRYGENLLHTTGSIELLENGDIILLGDVIDGTYSRPSQAVPDQMVCGTFAAKNKMWLTAADGIARTGDGFQAQDSEASFSCTGPVELCLLKGEQPAAVPPREEVGMLNLTVMQYTNVGHLRAKDQVRVDFHGQVPGQESVQSGSMSGDLLDIDTRAATIRVDAGPGRPAILAFGANRIEAQSPDAASQIELLPNGDIDVRGSGINTTLQGEEGITRTFCRDSIHLDRLQGILTTGCNADVHSPSGIFTANGPLTITLAPKDGATAAPLSPDHPQLSYPFAGVSRIRTEQGGTLRTTSASMQCTGPVDIELDPTASGDSGSAGSIKRATASGQVAILGKDQQGRLLRATGDRVEMDAQTGVKLITGRKVTLSNEYNTHTATGAGAAVRVDRYNNARITGAKQTTTATSIPKQVEANKQSKK